MDSIIIAYQLATFLMTSPTRWFDLCHANEHVAWVLRYVQCTVVVFVREDRLEYNGRIGHILTYGYSLRQK